MSKTSNNREYSFDILRVIAMTMVIVIHVSNIYCRNFGEITLTNFVVSLTFNTISRVCVPIFLMISGALMLERDFNKKKYFKRIKRFIFLIIAWDIIYLVWEYFYFGIRRTNYTQLLYDPFRSHLWFLYTILVLYTIQPLLKKILHKINNPTKIVLLIIWIVLSTVSIWNYHIALYFTIFSYTGFFILGKYLYDYAKNNDLKKNNILLIVIMILCFTCSIILNYTHSIDQNRFYNLFFAYRTPFIMIASFALYILIITNYRKNYLNKTVMKLSELSLGVYLIHGIFLDITNKVFVYTASNPIITIPIFVFIIFILSVISTYIIKKIKYLNKLI